MKADMEKRLELSIQKHAKKDKNSRNVAPQKNIKYEMDVLAKVGKTMYIFYRKDEETVQSRTNELNIM